jgi:multiple sugar transport system substrate-binding protein
MLRGRIRTLALAAAAIALLTLTATGCGGGDDGGSRTINWYVFKEPGGAFDEGVKNCNKQADGKYEIKLVPLPTDANQQRELLVRRLAAEDDSIDIAGMDVIWTAEFAEAEWVLPVPDQYKQEVQGNTLKGPLETATYKDELYAIPHNSNTQLLWYRKDRVKTPPKTWDEMIEMAEQIGDDGKIQVQAARYEGFTVWFNTLIESAGGKVIGDNGDVDLPEGPAVKADEVIKKLADSSAADPAISNAKEDQARLQFQEGGSSFMVNYPFVFPSAKKEVPEIFKNMGVAPYPGVEEGQPAKVTLGGLNLGVSKFSKNPDLAFEAAMCLRNEENQKINAEVGGLPPTIEALYDSPEIKKAYPGFEKLMRETIDAGVPRPVTPAYSDISLTIQQTLHPPGGQDPKAAIDKLRDRLNTVKEGGIY